MEELLDECETCKWYLRRLSKKFDSLNKHTDDHWVSYWTLGSSMIFTLDKGPDGMKLEIYGNVAETMWWYCQHIYNEH